MAPLGRKRSLPDDKRELLFREARREFCLGYEQASFNRIISRSGISKGSVYYHFADKADLFTEVVIDTFAKIGEGIGPLPEPKTAAAFWTNVTTLVTGFDAVALKEPELGAIGRAVYSTVETNNTLVNLRSRAEAWVQELLKKGQGVGAVRDDLPLSLLARVLTSLSMGLDRWFLEHWESLNKDQLEKLSAKSLDLYRNMLEPR